MKPRWLPFLSSITFSFLAGTIIGCGSSAPTTPKIPSRESFEFRILANAVDDLNAFENARKLFADDNRKPEVAKLISEGKAPPPPLPNPDERAFPNNATYSWVPMGAAEVRAFEQGNGAKEKSADWQRIVEGSEKGTAVIALWPEQAVVYSHKTGGGIKYYYLTRNPEKDPAKEKEFLSIDGQFLESATAGVDASNQPVITVTLTKNGADRLYNLTLKNEPTIGAESKFYRTLAALVKGEVISVIRLTTAIHRESQLTGPFTPDELAQRIKAMKGE